MPADGVCTLAPRGGGQWLWPSEQMVHLGDYSSRRIGFSCVRGITVGVRALSPRDNPLAYDGDRGNLLVASAESVGPGQEEGAE